MYWSCFLEVEIRKTQCGGLEMGNSLGMHTFAVLGYSGGACKSIAQHPLHFAIDDMQIAEDLQLIIGHMIVQYLFKYGPSN